MNYLAASYEELNPTEIKIGHPCPDAVSGRFGLFSWLHVLSLIEVSTTGLAGGTDSVYTLLLHKQHS